MRLVLVFLVATIAAIGSPNGIRPAAADRSAPDRVITMPTAWIPHAGGVVATGTLDHRLAGSVDVGLGVGDIAELSVGTDSDVRICDDCEGAGRGDARPIYLGRATFRLGAPEDAWFSGMPAVVFGVRASFASSGPRRARVGEAYVVASRELGPLRLHAGAMAFDGSLDDERLGTTVRPIAGLAWTPGQYPRTSVLADLAWAPLLRTGDTLDMEWIGGLGVRYQALSWGSIDLVVRHRKDDGLGDNTVLVRLVGAFDRTSERAPDQNKQR